MFSDPRKNIQELGFNPGDRVADLGSGVGHYSFPLSDSVGPKGDVYCIDIKKEVLVALKNQAEKEGRENIEVIWGDIEKMDGTKLRDSVVDGVLFSSILFQLKDKVTALKEAKRILKLGGKLCVIEWADLSYLSGVKETDNESTINKEELTTLASANGFHFQKSFEAGEHHYGLIFTS
jgi:ubiquinone/menaquinone biosynthesis C-methylase UbiE